MPPQASNIGRFFAGLVGLGIGCITTYYMTKDFELVKFEPAESPYDENGKRKRFNVSFREMQPLELTPEAAERRRKEALAKQEREQIIQEPTS